jgi:hypothetical protein
MAKKIQLSIPEPCHENWNDMTPVDKGRFCGSCQKQVVDFSNMSDREVAQFFKKPSIGSVCGRFMQDQLNRDLTIPKKRIPWVKYFFQVALPAFLFSAKAKAQGSVVKVSVEKLVKSKTPDCGLDTLKDKVPSHERLVETGFIVMATPVPKIIRGKVVDDQNNPLSSASIFIKGTSIGTVTDSAGFFSLKVRDTNKDITILASYVGFASMERRIRKEDTFNENSIMLMPLNLALSGEVVIVGMISSKKGKKKKPIPIIPEIKDTTTKTFKVYPNPVSSGSNVTLEWKETEEGYYIAQLINQSGQAVFTKEIWIDAEARVLSLDLPTAIAGNYFIRVVNKKSGKNSTEKIIIQ